MFQKIKSLIYTNNVLEEKAFTILFAVPLRVGLASATYCDAGSIFLLSLTLSEGREEVQVRAEYC